MTTLPSSPRGTTLSTFRRTNRTDTSCSDSPSPTPMTLPMELPSLGKLRLFSLIVFLPLMSKTAIMFPLCFVFQCFIFKVLKMWDTHYSDVCHILYNYTVEPDKDTQIYCQFLSKFDWEGWGEHYLKYLHKISHKSQEGILLPSANILFVSLWFCPHGP